MRSLLPIVLAVGLTTACASGPRPTSPSTGRSGDQTLTVLGRTSSSTVRLLADDQTRQARLSVQMQAAWAQLPILLEDLGLPVSFLDAATRTVAFEGERVRRINGRRLSNFIDCGMGATAQQYADVYSVVFAYEIRLKPDPAGNGVSVEMRVDASAKPMAVSGGAIRCTSEGVLEALVFERLAMFGRGSGTAPGSR